ncbi:MAG: T9SS type A sorting domain-containing protein [Chitinophagales bacterium]|nr:T9SS type A sorting domain-containing protein [Chitinophagales bacterium]
MKNYLTSLLLLISFSIHAQITQPAQPSSGPGGSDYTHGGVTIYDYATNGNGEDFWLYEPNNPVPDSANVIVFCHGLGMTNPKAYGAFIKHLVRKGNIVIYPRYQRTLNLGTGIAEYNDSCAKGIKKALDTIQQPGHVKGRVYNYFILGHSVGGVLTANMTMLYQQYGLPKPLTAFSMQPGASTYLMNDYSPFPADVKFLIAVGDNDAIVGTAPGTTIYNQTVAVPTSHKNLIHHYADNHGSPAIQASHNEPCGFDNQFDNGETNLFIPFVTGTVDAMDYFCYWKLQDALMDCALNNQNCEYAFGDTPEQHGMGNWSDGTPVRILEVTPGATTLANNLENDLDISIYPNPNSAGRWQLLVGSKIAGNEFILFDVNGGIIVQSPILHQESQIETGETAKGVYFYQIKNSSNEILKSGKLAIN